MYEKYWNKKYIRPELERMMKMRLRIFLIRIFVQMKSSKGKIYQARINTDNEYNNTE